MRDAGRLGRGGGGGGGGGFYTPGVESVVSVVQVVCDVTECPVVVARRQLAHKHNLSRTNVKKLSSRKNFCKNFCL